MFASISLTLVFIWNICFLTFLVLAYLTPRQLQVIPLLVVLFVNQAIHQLSVMPILSKSWCNLIKPRPNEMLWNSPILPKIPFRCFRCFNFEYVQILSLSTSKYFFPYVHGGWILCTTNHLQLIYHYYHVFNLSIQCFYGFWCFPSLYSKINK